MGLQYGIIIGNLNQYISEPGFVLLSLRSCHLTTQCYPPIVSVQCGDLIGPYSVGLPGYLFIYTNS